MIWSQECPRAVPAVAREVGWLGLAQAIEGRGSADRIGDDEALAGDGWGVGRGGPGSGGTNGTARLQDVIGRPQRPGTDNLGLWRTDSIESLRVVRGLGVGELILRRCGFCDGADYAPTGCRE